MPAALRDARQYVLVSKVEHAHTHTYSIFLLWNVVLCSLI